MNDKANIESVTKQEFINYINKENKFYSLKKLEDSEVFNYIGAPMLVEKQVNKIDHYLWYITKVYHCVDGFVGVTGVDVIYSDMDADDFCETCHAEEYSPIPSTKYVPKSSIESVLFNSQQPTQKQLDYIQAITDALGIEFNGNTKEDARQWLSKNVPKYKESLNELNLMHEANMQEIYDNYGDQI